MATHAEPVTHVAPYLKDEDVGHKMAVGMAGKSIPGLQEAARNAGRV
jgi:hypothetical protein